MAFKATNKHTVNLTVLSSPIDPVTGATGKSIFSSECWSLDGYNGLFITPRLGAQNFRHRLSEPGYFSDWHMAGDATMIIIRTGILRLGLRKGEYKDFHSGDLFIAKDCLKEGEDFDSQIHGHTAAVIGDEILTAVHVKLSEG